MNRSHRNEYEPDSVSPPGETLLETLEFIGMTQKELADRTGRAQKTINRIIKGEDPITPETAIQLERVLRIPAGFWNNRERLYRQSLARQDERRRLQEEISWLKEIPIKSMVKIGWIEHHDDKVQQAREALNFFGVASVEQWRRFWLNGTGRLQLSFRKSKVFKTHQGAVAAWLQKGILEAQAIRCAPYDPAGFRETLTDIRALILKLPGAFQRELADICAAVGVAVVFVPGLPKVPVSAVTHWLTPIKALVQLSLRFKTNDHFWFSFFHEAGHLILHGKRDVFLEEEGIRDEKESEADRLAADTLIPPAEMKRFIRAGQLSKRAIRDFASEVGIAPGIVVGRLQHDGILPPSHCNDLKQHLVWAD